MDASNYSKDAFSDNAENDTVDARIYSPNFIDPVFEEDPIVTHQKNENMNLSIEDFPHYNLNGVKQVIVFNHLSFEQRFQLAERTGTAIDVDSIRKTFSTLNWKVKVHHDLTVAEIRKVIEKVSKMNLSALALFILSHGDSDDTIYAVDNIYNMENTIIFPLRPDQCPGLAEKPKLVFIQVRDTFKCFQLQFF